MQCMPLLSVNMRTRQSAQIPLSTPLHDHTIESTSDARISETILEGWLSRSFMMLSMTDSSVAVVSCTAANRRTQHSVG